jgi:hypothetical protein
MRSVPEPPTTAGLLAREILPQIQSTATGINMAATGTHLHRRLA